MRISSMFLHDEGEKTDCLLALISGGIVATYLFLDSDAPYFTKGYAVCPSLHSPKRTSVDALPDLHLRREQEEG